MKRNSKARSRALALTFGHVAFWAASLGLGAFGVAGWVASSDNLAAQVLLGAAAGLSACVIPATVHYVGRGWVSGLLALAVLPFGFIAAYSTHHANEVLLERPNRAVWTAEADQAVRTWAQRVEVAQAKLDGLQPLALDPTMPKGRVEAQAAAWKAQQAPLAQAVADARAGHAAAVVARDERAAAYVPMASDLAVWLVAGSIDLAIAIGIAVLSAIVRRKPAEPKRKTPNRKPAKRPATAPRGVKDWKPRVVS
jgi:hypothetical protein